ncbi:MAG: invasion associated locus B family protein [Methylobacteriaceae bacterium]|nr:invasion associated locus B family protein [Methylobacteriaceae bacterium]
MILAPGQSWTKICGTDPNNVETCVTSGIFIVEKDGGRGITLYAYEVKSNPPQKQVRFMVPLGFQLQRGVRLTLDEKNVFPGRYEVCVPPGCYVGMENGDKLIAAMLKAKNGTLTVQDMRSAAINVSFPLDEFEKAFNGKPVDPEELTRQREKLEQELVKRSDEMRKQLLGEGADENAPAADASPAP